MRESEEYLRDNIEYLADGNLVEISNAEHAVKLAYKEGYLEALDKVKALVDDIFGAYVPWEMIQFEVELNKLKEEN